MDRQAAILIHACEHGEKPDLQKIENQHAFTRAQSEYSPPGSQKSGCGFPIMGVLNHSHGGWEDFAEEAIDLRLLRWEPGDRKKRPKNFSSLIAPRAECKEIPHLGKARSLA